MTDSGKNWKRPGLELDRLKRSRNLNPSASKSFSNKHELKERDKENF